MARISWYWAALRPGIDERKVSRMAQAPSTASSRPGRRHTELLLIQPLRNNVSPSAGHKKRRGQRSAPVINIIMPLESLMVCVVINTRTLGPGGPDKVPVHFIIRPLILMATRWQHFLHVLSVFRVIAGCLALHL